MAELRRQLDRAFAALPARTLPVLRRVPVRVEWASHPEWLATYHWAGPLAGTIAVTYAAGLVAAAADQPWAMLHELAHAWHHRALGEGDPRVLAAYRLAMARRLYPAGSLAAREHREYFAELTEAYLGRNEAYPHDRAELAAHDPAGFAMMGEAWGA